MENLYNWNQVAAPNFGASIQGVGMAAGLLSNAAETAKRGVQVQQDFDANQLAKQKAANALALQQSQQLADTWAQQKMLTYPDQASYQKALSDGSFWEGADKAGIDRSLMSQKANEALAGRSADLLGNATKAQEYGAKQTAIDNAASKTLRQTAFNTSLNGLLSAPATDVGKARTAYETTFAQLPPDEQVAYRETAVKAAMPEAEAAVRALISSKGSPAQAASYVAGDINQRGLPDFYAQAYRQAWKNVTGGDLASVVGDNTSNTEVNYATGTNLSGNTNSSVGSGYDRQYADDKYAPTKVLITTMTGSQLDAHQRTMIANSKGKIGQGDLGSGAVGRYMINRDNMQTIGKQLYGADWANTVVTPEVQDRIGETLYNSTPKAKLDQVWVALKGHTNELTGKWDHDRDVIAKYESDGAPANTFQMQEGQSPFQNGLKSFEEKKPVIQSGNDVNQSLDILKKQVSADAGKDVAGNNMPALFQAAASDIKSDQGDIINKLTAKGGAFEGEDPKLVEDNYLVIKAAAAEYAKKHPGVTNNLTPALIGAIMENNRKTSNERTNYGDIGTGLGGKFLNSLRYNPFGFGSAPYKASTHTVGEGWQADVGSALEGQYANMGAARSVINNKMDEAERAAKELTSIGLELEKQAKLDQIQNNGVQSEAQRNLRNRLQVAQQKYYKAGATVESLIASSRPKAAETPTEPAPVTAPPNTMRPNKAKDLLQQINAARAIR